MITCILIAQAAAPVRSPQNVLVMLPGLIFWGSILYFWIKMLLDCLRNEVDGSKRIAWVIVIILTNILGATLYYFVIKRNRGKSTIFQNQTIRVARNGVDLGEMDVIKMKLMISNSQLSMNDYYFDKTNNTWEQISKFK